MIGFKVIPPSNASPNPLLEIDLGQVAPLQGTITNQTPFTFDYMNVTIKG
jgi:hypothetical protein